MCGVASLVTSWCGEPGGVLSLVSRAYMVNMYLCGGPGGGQGPP